MDEDSNSNWEKSILLDAFFPSLDELHELVRISEEGHVSLRELIRGFIAQEVSLHGA